MTPADLAVFMAWRGLSVRRLARELGTTRDRVARWLRGEAIIPRSVALACGAIAYGLPPWSTGSVKDASEEARTAQEASPSD